MTTNTLASVTKNGQDTSTKPNYSVKNIEPVVIGTDVQARIFTLAPGEFIPWHRHSESMDHYFVLRGTLSISTRDPNDERVLEMGGRYKITRNLASHCKPRENGLPVSASSGCW